MSRSPLPRAVGALIRLGPVVAYVCGVFFFGSMPGVGPPGKMSDKLMHAIVFGFMAPFVTWATPYFRENLSIERRLAVATAVTSAVGALLELWQAFLPYRSSEFLDWLADTVGALVVAGILLGWSLATRTARSVADRGR